MTDSESTYTAPLWVVRAVVGSVALALVSFLVGGASTMRVTGLFVVTAALGVVYLLYLWGQHRERPESDGDDSRRERERKMEAEAGGYGGNGGGM